MGRLLRDNTIPTVEQLQELYEAAAVFKREQPWEFLFDSDIICVENPKDKMVGYCSVMGMGGEHYALRVYLGENGFSKFCQLLEQGDTIPHHQLLHYQNCLMCSFEDRDLLTNQDRKQIKDLGLSFRGKNAWPLLRRYEPGYPPGYINEDECAFLTHALRETLLVVGQLMTGQLEMDMAYGRTIKRYSVEKNGRLEWYSKEMQLMVPKVVYRPLIISDDVLFQQIKRAGSMRDVSLQVDTCYFPSIVQENKAERPYFPRIFVLAEALSGMLLDCETFENISDDANVTINRLIDICLEKGVPQEIQVRGEAMEAILEDFCKKAGIKLKVVKRLPAIDSFMREMEEGL